MSRLTIELLCWVVVLTILNLFLTLAFGGDDYRLKPIDRKPIEKADALDEVNAQRTARGLRPYIKDEGLTKAALACARVRAAHGIHGHLPNDFVYLPAGVTARATGCAAWKDGFGACGLFSTTYTTAGAAWVIGKDGLRYCHVFYR